MNDFELIYIFPILIFGFLIFLALRMLVLWYYKINKRVELLEENNLLLKKMLKHFTNEDYKLLSEKEKENIPLKNKEE